MAHDNLGLLKVNLYKYKFNQVNMAGLLKTDSLPKVSWVGQSEFFRPAQADQFAKINEDLKKLWAH